MKKTKILASLMVLVTLMSTFTATLASASEVSVVSTEANLTIENDSSITGISIKDKTYNLYQVFDATVTETETEDDEEAIEYFANADFYAFFNEKLGITYPNADDYEDEYATDEDGLTYSQAVDSYNHAATDYVDGFSETTDEKQELVSMLREYIITQELEADYVTGQYQKTGTSYETVVATDVELGYYVVFDTQALAASLEEDTTTDVTANNTVTNGSLVTIPGRATDGTMSADVTISLKGNAPTIDKEIWHNDLNTSGGWDNVGDYEIGDTVEFRLTVEVPSDISAYDEYTFIITDTLSDGLEFNDDIEIYTDAALTEGPVEGSLHTTTYGSETNDYTFQLNFNMKAIKEGYATLETFYIYYTATVTEDALMYTDYEQNTVSLVYSNNPYDSSSYGTSVDTVYEYSFEANVLKTKGDGVTPLADAVFALYEVESTDGGTIETQIYLAQKTDDDLDVATYYISEGNASSDQGVITTDDTGLFNIIGLDDAKTYVLKEISAPEGYNTADPIQFKITATYATSTTGAPTPTVTVSGGVNSLDFTVINTSAKLLPETGGMGTTVFMVAGGSIMVAALVLFVIKRKRTN